MCAHGDLFTSQTSKPFVSASQASTGFDVRRATLQIDYLLSSCFFFHVIRPLKWSRQFVRKTATVLDFGELLGCFVCTRIVHESICGHEKLCWPTDCVLIIAMHAQSEPLCDLNNFLTYQWLSCFSAIIYQLSLNFNLFLNYFSLFRFTGHNFESTEIVNLTLEPGIWWVCTFLNTKSEEKSFTARTKVTLCLSTNEYFLSDTIKRVR